MTADALSSDHFQLMYCYRRINWTFSSKFIYNFFSWGTREHASMHCQQGKSQLWVNCQQRKVDSIVSHATLPPTAVLSALSTRPWAIYVKHTNRMVTDTWDYSKLITGKNESSLGCLYLTLVYKYYFLYGGDMMTCLGALVVGYIPPRMNCVMWWMPVVNRWPHSLPNTCMHMIIHMISQFSKMIANIPAHHFNKSHHCW